MRQPLFTVLQLVRDCQAKPGHAGPRREVNGRAGFPRQTRAHVPQHCNGLVPRWWDEVHGVLSKRQRRSLG